MSATADTLASISTPGTVEIEVAELEEENDNGGGAR
jgi:hypothetical protein